MEAPGAAGARKRDKITDVRPLPKFLWFMLALFAFVNALEALRYLLPHVPFPVQMENFTHRRIALSLHAMGGAIALLAGPLQFVPRFRESNWNRHRLLGWIYCSAVLLGWCASLWIAPHSQTGWMASAAFLALGAAWIVTTGLAVRFHFARRCDQAPALDDSQLCPHSCRDHTAHVLASDFRVPLAFFDRLPRLSVALLDPQCVRRRGVSALRANAFGHSSACQPGRPSATSRKPTSSLGRSLGTGYLDTWPINALSSKVKTWIP